MPTTKRCATWCAREKRCARATQCSPPAAAQRHPVHRQGRLDRSPDALAGDRQAGAPTQQIGFQEYPLAITRSRPCEIRCLIAAITLVASWMTDVQSRSSADSPAQRPCCCALPLLATEYEQEPANHDGAGCRFVKEFGQILAQLLRFDRPSRHTCRSGDERETHEAHRRRRGCDGASRPSRSNHRGLLGDAGWQELRQRHRRVNWTRRGDLLATIEARGFGSPGRMPLRLCCAPSQLEKRATTHGNNR